MNRTIVIISSFFIFAVLNYSILQKERIIADGEVVYLALAPLDPRSLMQGDYMSLAYAVENEAGHTNYAERKRGHIVVRLEGNGVARFARFEDGKPLSADERLMRYHSRYGRINVVPDSYFFQEGTASVYEAARFGIFRFDKSGNYLLVGLADGEFRKLDAAQEF